MSMGRAAAGVGHRPENSDQGTTSLEMPPTSDGFKRPELGPKANSPRSRILDRSASAPASVFSRGSGRAPEDSLPECPETLASEELFPPPPPLLFPDAVASADAALDGKDGAEPEPIPSQTTSGPPAPSSGQQEDTLRPPVKGGGRSLSNPRAKDMDPVHELHSCTEVFPDAAPLLFKEESQKILLSAGRGDTEGEAGISFPEGRNRAGDDSMEVDHPKAASSGDANLPMEVELPKPGSPPPPPQNDPAPEDPCVSLSHALKELHQLLVVSSKHEAVAEEHRSISFPGHVKSFVDEAREAQWMGESREKEAVAESFEYEIESVEVTKVQQLDEGHEKEPVAESFAYKIESVEVKEVQRLGENSETEALLESFAGAVESLGAREVQRMDESREKETAVESFVYEIESVEMRKVQQLDEGHEKEAPLESLAYEMESVEVEEVQQLDESHEKEVVVESFAYEMESVEVRKVQPLDEGREKEAPLESLAYEMESVEVEEAHRSAEKEALIARESSTTLEQLCGAERCASPPRLLAPEAPEAQKAPQSLPGSFPGGTGPHLPSGDNFQSSPDAAPLPPPSPPVPGVDQIVRAGFTAQEAGEALAQADGNADLALLLLLAKNIVVPT